MNAQNTRASPAIMNPSWSENHGSWLICKSARKYRIQRTDSAVKEYLTNVGMKVWLFICGKKKNKRRWTIFKMPSHWKSIIENYSTQSNISSSFVTVLSRRKYFSIEIPLFQSLKRLMWENEIHVSSWSVLRKFSCFPESFLIFFLSSVISSGALSAIWFD